MGNATLLTPPPTQRQAEESLQYVDTRSTFSHFPIFSSLHGEHFIGREIDLPQNYGREMIMQNMRTSKQAEAILPIQHFEFRAVSTVCSQQQKCLLLSKKPEQTLQNMYKSRRVQNQAFRASQINSIIERIALALQAQEQKQLNLQLDMESIVLLHDKAYLVNSLMYDGEKASGQIFGRYRAPQTMDGRYDCQEANGWLWSQLFALGVIGLSLAFIQINMEVLIYYKGDRVGKKGVSQVQISILLDRIRNANLASKLRVLLSFDPKTRERVYGLIANDSKPATGSSKLDQQSEIRSEIKRNEQMVGRQSRVVQNKVEEKSAKPMGRSVIFRETVASVVDNKGAQPRTQALMQKMYNSTILHCDPRSSQPRKESFAIIVTAPQKVNVPNYPQANKQNVCLNLSQKSELKPKIHQNHASSDTITPQKERKRKQFSTIKQVTQYDDCNSASYHKSIDFLSGKFEGRLIDGKKQGFGVFYFDQGSRYQGEWCNDKMHGFGKLYYYGDKLAYQGYWNEGEFHGNGKVYNNEPLELSQAYDYNDLGNLTEEWVSYEGQLEHDKREGWGILKLSNGQRLEGEFREDMVEGKGIFYSLEKGEIRGIWSGSRLVRRDDC